MLKSNQHIMLQLKGDAGLQASTFIWQVNSTSVIKTLFDENFKSERDKKELKGLSCISVRDEYLRIGEITCRQVPRYAQKMFVYERQRECEHQLADCMCTYERVIQVKRYRQREIGAERGREIQVDIHRQRQIGVTIQE